MRHTALKAAIDQSTTKLLEAVEHSCVPVHRSPAEACYFFIDLILSSLVKSMAEIQGCYLATSTKILRKKEVKRYPLRSRVS
jgi:hypothetical protein